MDLRTYHQTIDIHQRHEAMPSRVDTRHQLGVRHLEILSDLSLLEPQIIKV